jgi:hypothetical protein
MCPCPASITGAAATAGSVRPLPVADLGRPPDRPTAPPQHPLAPAAVCGTLSIPPSQEKYDLTRTTARITGLAGALVAGTLLLAGCADDSSETAHNGPMMGNSDTSDSASDGAEGTANDTDVAFARDMIPHHRQAIQMARLAQGQAADPRVIDLADRIEAAQQPEIETLSGWLEDWDAPLTPPGRRRIG